MRYVNRRVIRFAVLLWSAINSDSCRVRAGTNPLRNVPDHSGSVADFSLGLWQGLICPIAFTISPFSDSVHVYDVHHNVGSYSPGVLLGTGTMLSGSGAEVSRVHPVIAADDSRRERVAYAARKGVRCCESVRQAWVDIRRDA